ncbi:MAG: AEC family transporter [Sporolactobacillus sp.]
MSFFIVLHQVIIIFLLMSVGFFSHKWGLISEDGSRDMTRLLLYIVSPCVILKAFQQPFSLNRLRELGLSFLCVVLLLVLAILTAQLLFSRPMIKNDGRRKNTHFATIYTNAGFMGIPLVSALLGSSGVFYATPYLAAANLFMWTHGISLYRKKQSIKAKLANMLNPNIMTIAIGVILFAGSFRISGIADHVISDISNLNTPLSMIVIGDSIAAIPLLNLFSDRLTWLAVTVHNVLMPLEAAVLFRFVAVSDTAKLVVILLSACPVAGVIVLFAVLNRQPTAFPTQIMALSTLLSVLSIPMVTSLCLFVLRG